MDIHFLEQGEMYTPCGLSTAGFQQVAITRKKREITCLSCKIELGLV